MTIVQEDQILKAHVSKDGRVWYADGLETPVPADQDLSAFVADVANREHPVVRVLGTASNAELITALYQKCCSPRGSGRLEVASPAICETVAERGDPMISLYRMRQCLLSPSLGGWHQVDELDYPTYAIAAQLQRDAGFSEHVHRLLKTHPAYHDLMFIPTLSPAHAAILIGRILDPRWFVDLRHPERLARLTSYLGIYPMYMRQVMSNDLRHERAISCYLTLTAWSGGGFDVPAVDYQDNPRNFLWRRWQTFNGGVRGNLRATRVFLSYFIRTWQQQLVSKLPQQLEMFIPSSLLNRDEVEAYHTHSLNRPAR